MTTILSNLDRLIDTAKNWVSKYYTKMLPFVAFSNNTDEHDEIYFVDLINQSAYPLRKEDVGFDGNFGGEVGHEVDPSNYAAKLPSRQEWYKIVRSTWEGVVIEVENTIWVFIPREMIYEER